MRKIMQIIYKMKKILISSIIILIGFSLKAQNSLEFNRVIDTVLVLNIGSSSTNISSKVFGESISPPINKVWKINNIYIDYGSAVNFSGYDFTCFKCNNPADPTTNAFFGVDVFDGANEFILRRSQPQISQQPILNDPVYILGDENAIWMNHYSTLRTFIVQKQLDNNPSTPAIDDVCIRDFTGKIYVSLLEFNTP